MDFDAIDDHDQAGHPSEHVVRFRRGDEDAVGLRYGTFDVILGVLHDLWWRDRRIGRLRLLADWIADRGLFDPETARSIVDDPAETAAALALARDRLARRADRGDEVDAALVALIRLLDEAIASDLPVTAELA